MQGCRTVYLGRMDYRLFATPDFIKKWFADGFNLKSVMEAPALIFNRKDDLHNRLFTRTLGEVPSPVPAHYVPSSEKFAFFISAGFAYGMLPDQQSQALEDAGEIVNLAPDCTVSVRLYWHCWNLESRLLKKLSRIIVNRAGKRLAQ